MQQRWVEVQMWWRWGMRQSRSEGVHVFAAASHGPSERVYAEEVVAVDG